MGQLAVDAMLDVATVAGITQAIRIPMPYQRVDMARNNIVRIFMKHSTSEEDVVVMLDCDHRHPEGIIPRLAMQCDAEHEIVAALAFRRSKPHDPVVYRGVYENGATDGSDIPTQFSGKLEDCDIVGTGAIAIRRSVFTKLDQAGIVWPYFRFVYKDGLENAVQRTEDWDFGLKCKSVGIKAWVDTGFETPHVSEKLITHRDWFETLEMAAKDPERFAKEYSMLGMTLKEA